MYTQNQLQGLHLKFIADSSTFSERKMSIYAIAMIIVTVFWLSALTAMFLKLAGVVVSKR